MRLERGLVVNIGSMNLEKNVTSNDDGVPSQTPGFLKCQLMVSAMTSQRK